MKQRALIVIILICMFSCQNEKTVLETEKDAFYSTVNTVIDSVYLTITEQKIPTKHLKKIVVYDSLIHERPSFFEISRRHKEVKQFLIDTIANKIAQKIDLQVIDSNSNFELKYKLPIKKTQIEEEFWNSDYALDGILIFSKISFDKEKRLGVYSCTYSQGDFYKQKHFLVYIRNEKGDWKTEKVELRNINY